MFDEGMTIADARDKLREIAKDGGSECPVCRQHAQVYRRKLNTGMVRSLITMWKAAGLEWQHIPTTVGGKSREEGKLRYWGLIEEQTERREDGGRAGWWRVTNHGHDWLRGRVTVASHVLVYDGRMLRGEGEQITVADALGEPFDFAELMGEPSAAARAVQSSQFDFDVPLTLDDVGEPVRRSSGLDQTMFDSHGGNP